MIFLYPRWLWLLAAIPILYWLVLKDEKRRETQFARFADRSLWNSIAPDFDPKARPRKARHWLFALAFVLLALARPQWGTHEETVKVTGLDIMIVLDVSSSMDAEDVAPSRLKKAKHLLRSTLDRLQGDRVGAVAFAASAYLASPLTTDLDYVKEVIQYIGPHSILNQGTDIGLGLETAIKALERGSEEGDSGRNGKLTSQALILVSDGEDHEARALDLANRLRQTGIKLFVFGVGTEKGGPIPNRDESGALRGYKRSSKGESVVTTFRPDALMKLASEGGGRYWNVTPGEAETEELLQEMGALNRTDLGEKRYVVREDRFQIPLLIAVLFFLLELSIPLRKKVASAAAAMLVTVFFTGCGGTNAFSLYDSVKKGVEDFNAGKIPEAKEKIGAAQAQKPDSPELKFDQAVIQAKEGDLENADRGFSEAAKLAEDNHVPALSAKAHFNRGNLAAKKGDMPGAVGAYLAAIDAAKRAKDPELEKDARKNLELLVSESKKQQEKDKKDQEKQDKQDQKDQKDQQDQKDKKDQKDQKDKQDQSDKKDQQDKDGKQEKNQQGQQYEDPSKKKKQKFRSLKLSDEDAERVMSELKSREQELQGKLKKQQGKAGGKNEKDW